MELPPLVSLLRKGFAVLGDGLAGDDDGALDRVPSLFC